MNMKAFEAQFSAKATMMAQRRGRPASGSPAIPPQGAEACRPQVARLF